MVVRRCHHYSQRVMKSIPIIAIIDDDESVRHSLRHLLRSADFNPLAFASAEEYLGVCGDTRPDCLIVDVNLPGMSGVELLCRLASSSKATPAILITARDDRATLERIERASSVPLLRKPFGDEELFDAISTALAS
jgi:FixJ family two-component response regulator